MFSMRKDTTPRQTQNQIDRLKLREGEWRGWCKWISVEEFVRYDKTSTNEGKRYYEKEDKTS